MTEKKENMESKKSTSVLIVIIAALTLTLVVLSIFVVFSSKTSQEFLGLKFGSNFSLETKMPKRPSQNEMATKRLFEENVIYNLKNDNGELSVIQVNVVIEYYKKVKGIRNVEKKINSFESAMRELVGNYFQNMTISEVKDPNTRLKAKEDLTIEINDLLNSDENKYYQIVYDVIFEKWFYQ
jgi:flagellar basal body-associated protein FliL